MDADYFNNHYYFFAEKPNPVEYKNVNIKLKSHESCYSCLTYNSLLYYVFYCTYHI